MSSTNAKINIKDLPEIQSVSNGDYLIVESTDGTYIIDYENFIIGPENTTLTASVEQNATDIASVSATASTQIQSLSTEMYSTFSRVYVGRATIQIDSGISNSALLSPRPPVDMDSILPTDVIITPANADACKYPAYLSFIDNTEESRGYLTITAPFTKKSYSISGAVTSLLKLASNADISGSTPIPNNNPSFDIISDLLNKIIAYADPTIQTTPYTVSVSDDISTADQLGVSPTYNVLVIKPY